MIKKLLLAIALILSLTTLSGCGSTLVSFVMNKFTVTISERRDANLNILGQMKDAGMVNEDLYERISKQIKKTSSDLLKSVKSIDESDAENLNEQAVKNIAGAASYVWAYKPHYITYIDDGEIKITEASNQVNTGSYTGGNIKDGKSYASFVLGNYILKSRTTSGEHSEYNLEQNELIPINLFGNMEKELEDTMNERFKLPIYVFDPSTVTGRDKSLDEVMAAINKAVTSNNISGVTNYFKPLKDKDGKNVTLLENDFKIYGRSKNEGGNSINRTGYDLPIYQDLYMEAAPAGKEPVSVSKIQCKLRFNEFYADNIDKLRDTIGLNSNKYYFQMTSAGTKAAYLLEYPVSVFGKTEIKDNKMIQIKYKAESGLGLNIGTGKIIVYDRDGDSYKNTGVAVNPDKQYLTTAFGAAKEALGLSSFVTKGYTNHKVTKMKADGTAEDIDVYVPRIVLRDYLEATWAPGIINNPEETLVVFGRKVRFKIDDNFWHQTKYLDTDNKYPQYNIMYNRDDSALKVAYYVDIEGKEVGSLQKLKIQDFANISSMLFGQRKEKWGGYKLQTYKERSDVDKSSTGTAIKSNKQPKISEIASETKGDFGTFNLTSQFPGKSIGNVDYSNTADTVQRFYVVATKHGMFENSLFADWINSTNSNASLDWWNGWLNSHGYKYKVEHEEVNQYLSDNFKFEMTQNGAIILDLKTVASIQKIYDEEDNTKTASLIRTIFIVLGFFLMAYTMILMLCWTLDTHTDLGMNTMNKATFGHWTPVAYESDIPTMKGGNKNYVDGKRLVLRSLMLLMISAILILININKIFLFLVDVFGQIAIWVQDKINF
jgi:lipoprotein